MNNEKESWEITVKLVIPRKDYDSEYIARETIHNALKEIYKNYNISSLVYDDME